MSCLRKQGQWKSICEKRPKVKSNKIAGRCGQYCGLVEYKKSTQPATIVPLTMQAAATHSRRHRGPDNPGSDSDQPAGIALIRADSRDSLRATVLRWITC